MIGVRKLKTLSCESRLRKISRLCQDWIHALENGGNCALDFYRPYIAEVLKLLPDGIPDGLSLLSWASGTDNPFLLRSVSTLRMRLEKILGVEAADWDFLPCDDTGRNRSFPLAVYLEDIRSPFNTGSIIRTAFAFGFEKIYLSPDTPEPGHPRVVRSAMGCVTKIPWRVCSLDEACKEFFGDSADDNIFCLETGGIDIHHFSFPRTGIVVLGNEELGVHPGTLARLGPRRASIPLYGGKASLNVSVAFGILANAWTLQQDNSDRN